MEKGFTIEMQWKKDLQQECIGKMFYNRNAMERGFTIGMHWKEVLQ